MRILFFLVDISIHLQGRKRHVYVEVVMEGQEEGKFLEDREAHLDEMMGDVLRLGGFWRCATERETDHFPC